jgi:hypothetical protein
MAVSEQDLADLLAGMTRVHLAIIRGLSLNHPRSAENIIRHLREEADLASDQQPPASLAALPVRYLLNLLDAKPVHRETAEAAAPPGKIARLISRPRRSRA